MLALAGVSGRARPLFFIILLTGLLTMSYLLFNPLFHDSERLHKVALLESASSYFKGSSAESTGTEEFVDDDNAPWTIPYGTDSANDIKIANNTLGFQSILVLGLPNRLLKRDSMELGASITNLNLTWIDGVMGGEMHPNSVPPYHDDPNARWFNTDSEVGCWRGHMNMMHKMVKERIASALILEDDADWDIHIVLQLQKFANVSRGFLAEDPNSSWRRKRRALTGSPYGEGWDILWIGHCGGFPAINMTDQSHIAVIHNDSTVPPAWDIKGQLFGIDPKKDYACSAQEGIKMPEGVVCDSPRLADDERLIQERTSPLCTTGYAISLQGARKMLARIGGLSLLDVDSPVDWEMIDMCRKTGKPGAEREAARCLTVSPAYIRTHRAKGPIKADSDILDKGNGTHDVGLSEGLVYPTRLNVENLIAGFEPESQYIQENGTWRYKTKDEYRSLP